MSNIKTIKVLETYAGVTDTNIIKRGAAVWTAMTGNSNYPMPPVDLAVLKAALDAFVALVAEAADGSRKVIAEKNKQRATVIEMLRMLGRYVEIASQGDLDILQTSGFQAASTTKTQAAPLSENIRKLEHGANTGQIILWLGRVRGASSYQFRYAPTVDGQAPTSWTEVIAAKVRAPIVLTNLTPGTTYAFGVRALVKDCYTDWSDSVTFMCT